jgi:peptidoglycan LD-endopeptidase LytH
MTTRAWSGAAPLLLVALVMRLMQTRLWRAAALAAMLALAASCATGPLAELTRPPSPHEEYGESLRQSGLDQTALGRDWVVASRQALDTPVEAALPFNESMYFAPDEPLAVGYRFSLPRGRQLSLDVSVEGAPAARLFVDLYRTSVDREPQRVTSLAPESLTLTHEVEADATYILRVQPELLRGGRFRIVGRTLASLPFPVPSLASRPVQSGFGAERDAGVRLHEGIDIFAAAGTPVIAVRGGMARPGTNNLGGNVVWLQDATSRRSFYYAHLERAAIGGPALVKTGDVIGYIGNTGNARTTGPHLHFGIYAGGALDPLPFVAADQEAPAPARPSVPLGAWARATRSALELRGGRTRDAPRAASLPRDTVFTVAGAVADSLRIVLPDGTTGYVARQGVASADSALRRRRLPEGTVLWDRPLEHGVAVRTIEGSLQAEVLGRFAGFDFVRLPEGGSGWVSAAATT